MVEALVTTVFCKTYKKKTKKRQKKKQQKTYPLPPSWCCDCVHKSWAECDSASEGARVPRVRQRGAGTRPHRLTADTEEHVGCFAECRRSDHLPFHQTSHVPECIISVHLYLPVISSSPPNPHHHHLPSSLIVTSSTTNQQQEQEYCS